MFRRKKKHSMEININMKNRNELDGLLETIQTDIAALKNDFDKLNQFKLTFDLEHIDNDTSDK